MILFLLLALSGDFEERIAPILVEHCLPCHSGSNAQGALRLSTHAGASKVIVPGSPEKSALYTSMETGKMPPAGRLPKDQRDLIRAWIADGAKWPNGINLEGMKLPRAERALVARLHDRIVAASGNDEFKPYQRTIPATSVVFEMLPIPEGDFLMGGPEKDESPQHKVHISSFWMGKFEVTWDEYRLFMLSKDEGVDAVTRPTRPYVEMSFGMGIEGFPAISMTQHAANKYAEWLSARTGQFYRLPAEAEWEYACRAGTTADMPNPEDYAWYSANSNGKYQKAGTKKPNAWGLYDMLGNVMEWTLDQYAPYRSGPATDPWIQATRPYPLSVRGGSWMDPAGAMRCGARTPSDPSWKQQDPQMPKSIWYETDAQGLGFRLVRPLKIPSAGEMFKYWNSGVEKDP